MVYNKINVLKLIILSVIVVVLAILTTFIKSENETNLLKAVIPDNVIKKTNIIDISNKTSSSIKVVYEADSENDLYKLKSDFENLIDSDYIEKMGYNAGNILSVYTKNPANFLSDKDIELIKKNDFNSIKQNAINELYNPMGIQIGNFCDDPYFLLTNFLKSIMLQNDVIEYKGKYYTSDIFNIREEKDLKVTNKQIQNLIKSQTQLTSKNTKIYLSGVPVHSYYTSKNAALSINVICVLATFLILFLTYFYFRNIKIFLPIALSIIMGLWVGYVTTKLLFPAFHIATLVFSTTLIGIGIDYSYHYMFTSNRNLTFLKNITFSMLTTVAAFTLLYLSNIELLKQISVFTVFGLITIYLFVLFIYPCFSFVQPQKSLNLNFNRKTKLIIITVFVCMSVFGVSKLKFNDSVTALYVPNKKLIQAETLYNIASNHNDMNTHIIKISGNNPEDVLEKEENTVEKLKKQNIDYKSFSKYMPSNKKQETNYNLVKLLYKNNLYTYSDILSKSQIKSLIKRKFIPSKFEDINFREKFFLDNNTSIIVTYSKNPPVINDVNAKIISINEECSKYLKEYRTVLIKFIPFVYLLIFILLGLVYNYKNSIIMILPPLLGSVSAICIVPLFNSSVNLFSIIALFLILGFTIDYSIFRVNGDNKSEDAVFISCITTLFSFLALSFTSFKFISSISLILFLGILISYISGLFLFKSDK